MIALELSLLWFLCVSSSTAPPLVDASDMEYSNSGWCRTIISYSWDCTLWLLNVSQSTLVPMISIPPSWLSAHMGSNLNCRFSVCQLHPCNVSLVQNLSCSKWHPFFSSLNVRRNLNLNRARSSTGPRDNKSGINLADGRRGGHFTVSVVTTNEFTGNLSPTTAFFEGFIWKYHYPYTSLTQSGSHLALQLVRS